MRGKKWSTGGRAVRLRHEQGLAEEVAETGRDDLVVERRAQAKRRRRKEERRGGDVSEEQGVHGDAKVVKRIRKSALEQREEEEERERKAEPAEMPALDDDTDAEEEFDEDELDEDMDYLDAERITDADEAALALFSGDLMPRRTLADIILAKIEEHENKRDEPAATPVPGLSPNVVEVCEGLAEVMHLYKSGKVPKAFKVIPSFLNWEEIMYLTRPDEWSNNAMLVATKLFISNLDTKQAQKFCRDVLLPRCQDDIASNKHLNCHLYNSLKKACFKPPAFFKGIILPLCEHGCTLREGTIFGSVVAKVSIPMMHSAAALLKLSQLPFSGPTSLFMRVLMDKKYALPMRVVDAICDHFMSMLSQDGNLPVLWHQCLLTFAQRYKTSILKSQKEQLKTLLRVHHHPQITPEIRIELFSSRSRGETLDPNANTIAMEVSAA